MEGKFKAAWKESVKHLGSKLTEVSHSNGNRKLLWKLRANMNKKLILDCNPHAEV